MNKIFCLTTKKPRNNNDETQSKKRYDPKQGTLPPAQDSKHSLKLKQTKCGEF